jgi:hypothetical protein
MADLIDETVSSRVEYFTNIWFRLLKIDILTCPSPRMLAPWLDLTGINDEPNLIHHDHPATRIQA